MRLGSAALALPILWLATGPLGAEPTAAPPAGRALQALVQSYLDADEAARARLREQWDASLAPLDPRTVTPLRKELLRLALAHGPRLSKKGTNWFFEKGRGKYIVSGKPDKALFVGLHGGGEGSGDAESAASAMSGGGWLWIYPEVLKKTERGWTDAGTDAFVLGLIDAAKRTWKLDPDRIYVTGHSMGGFGAWTLGGRHADVFAGIAAYAGAPTCVRGPGGGIEIVEPGIVPNLFNLRLHVYQSGDDRNVPPESNDFATSVLERWRGEHPDGFDFRYDRVEGRAHAGPREGYLPSLRWVAERARQPRPRKFLWQPTPASLRQFYWVHWSRPEMESVLQVAAGDDNRVEIEALEGSGDVSGLSVLLGPPLVDPTREVTILVNGKEAWRGTPRPTFSTLMMTLPRLDEHLLYDTRVDL